MDSNEVIIRNAKVGDWVSLRAEREQTRAIEIDDYSFDIIKNTQRLLSESLLVKSRPEDELARID